MKRNLEEELEKFIKGLGALRNIKEAVNDVKCEREDCCEGDCDEEDDEEDEECPIMISLEKDYKGFMKWAFNLETLAFSRSKAIKRWQKLHPTLPIPRVLMSEKELTPHIATICIFMDGYPLYLAEKNKSA